MIAALLAAATLAVSSPAPEASPPPLPPEAHPIAFAALPLARAESAALAASPDVAAARAVVDQNGAALRAARAAYGPAVVGGYVEAPQGGAAGTTVAQRMTTVGLQTTLGDLLAYEPLVASAAANLRAAHASLIAARRAERVRVVGLYYGALKARAISQARDAALETAREGRDAAQTRVRAGDAPRLDLVRADVALAAATAEAETAHASAQNALDALRVETATTAPLTAALDAPLAPFAVPDPAAAVAQAERLRADLRAAAETTAAARAAAAAAHRLLMPPLTIGAGYAAGVDSGVAVHGPTITVSLAVPLGGAASAVAAQKDAIVAQDVARQRAAQRQVALEVASAVRSVAAAQRAATASREARIEAAGELQATQLGYSNGVSSSLEVTAARDTYTQAVVNELSSLYDLLTTQAALQLEIGA